MAARRRRCQRVDRRLSSRMRGAACRTSWPASILAPLTPMAEQAPPAGRRRFLATLTAFAAASGVGARAVPAATRLTRVGVQLYTVRDLLQRDFEGTLARLAAIGFREVEFAGYHGRSPEQLAEGAGGGARRRAPVPRRRLAARGGAPDPRRLPRRR